MDTKVGDHLAAIRRRCREAQEFAEAAFTFCPLSNNIDRDDLEDIESSLDEIRVAAYSALKEVTEIRSYLGMPRD